MFLISIIVCWLTLLLVDPSQQSNDVCISERQYKELVERIEYLEAAEKENEKMRRECFKDTNATHLQLPKRQIGIETIAFYAILSAKTCFHHNDIFVFDQEITDNSGGYNPTSGTFIVPTTALYVFTVTIIADFYDCVEAEIHVNGDMKGSIFSDSQEVHDIHPASTTIMVAANAGDRVFVKRGNECKCQVISTYNYGQSSFAGWVLY